MNDDRAQPYTDTELRRLRALALVVRDFRELSPAFPSSYMLAFLAVAMRPGGGSTDYMQTLETAQPVASRILIALGPKGRSSEGFGLVDTFIDTIDMRRKHTYLTDKGKTLVARILTHMERL